MARRLWKRLQGGVLEALSPTRCASCERAGALICADCLRAMVRIDPVSSCLRCGAPFGSLVCTECSDARSQGSPAVQPPAPPSSPFPPSPAAAGPGADRLEQEDLLPEPAPGTPATPPAPRVLAFVDRCLAAAVFEGPPSRIIRAYKDGGERRLAPLIADLLFEAAVHAEATAPGRYAGLLSEADGIVFVPVTAAAYRRRGFDHMEAVAAALARRAGKPLVDALVKHGHADQRELGRSGRLAGSAGAYEVVLDVEGRSLLLLDDVITTGSTVGAAAQVLKNAGALRVDVLALARVW